jgi:centrosomal protein CEP290
LNKLKQSHQASVKGTEKNSSKLATEHEKLRKDLTKEIENSKTLKIKMAGLENALIEKDDQIAQLEQRLQEAESRAPNLEGLDSKQWKSAVVTRMFEQKLKSMEGELEKKVCLRDNIGYMPLGQGSFLTGLVLLQEEIDLMPARNAGLSSHRPGKLNNSKWPLSKISRAMTTMTSIPRRHQAL